MSETAFVKNEVFNEHTRKFAEDVGDFLTSSRTYSVGEVVATRREGFSYVVAGIDETARCITHPVTGQLIKVQPGENGYNIRAFGAVGDDMTDDTAAIQAACDTAASERPENMVVIPAGRYRVSRTITSAVSIKGAGARASLINAATPDFDVLKFTDRADFLNIGEFRIASETLSSGAGLTLERDNHNLSLSNIEVQNFSIGYNFAALGYVQNCRNLRATTCNTGLYADGRDTDGSSSGTTLLLDQFYSVDCETALDVRYYTSMLLLQPIFDLNGTAVNGIRTDGVGALTVIDPHFEGPPVDDGDLIRFSTSGTLGSSLNVVGGMFADYDTTGLKHHLIHVNAANDNVSVNVTGLASRGIKLDSETFRLSGFPTARIDINWLGNDWPDLREDVTFMLGTYRIRDYAKEDRPVLRGRDRLRSGGLINTGKGSTASGAVLTVESDADTLPVAQAFLTDRLNDGSLKVRFGALKDGSESSGMDFNVCWVAW